MDIGEDHGVEAALDELPIHVHAIDVEVGQARIQAEAAPVELLPALRADAVVQRVDARMVDRVRAEQRPQPEKQPVCQIVLAEAGDEEHPRQPHIHRRHRA
jgi:hypothetical protein